MNLRIGSEPKRHYTAGTGTAGWEGEVKLLGYLGSSKDDVGSGAALGDPVAAPPRLEPVTFSLHLEFIAK